MAVIAAVGKTMEDKPLALSAFEICRRCRTQQKDLNDLIRNIELTSALVTTFVPSIPYVLAWAESMPMPAWVKGENNVMKWINKAYAVRYGVDLHSYYEHPDEMVWDEVTANGFLANDREVVERGVPVIFNELCNIGDKQYTGTYLKFPLLGLNGNKIVGVGGLEITSFSGGLK